MTRNYHKSTLRKLSGKANYYVVVTKPKQLANRPKEVERRSTGTSDAKLAGKLKHKITQDIYSEWDAALERDRFMDTIKQYWDDTKTGQSIEETRTSGPALISGEKVVLIRTLMVRNLIMPASQSPQDPGTPKYHSGHLHHSCPKAIRLCPMAPPGSAGLPPGRSSPHVFVEMAQMRHRSKATQRDFAHAPIIMASWGGV